jgi:restriction system protein
MKLKMAENSLFAILLRSPWWISMAIAVLLSLAATAMLPARFSSFGSAAGFPFLTIGIIAAWRQLQAPSATRVARIVETVGAMPWRDFADALEQAYRRDGHEVRRLAGPAADFEIVKAGRTVLVSAKRWKVAGTGVEPLRELHAAMEKTRAQASVYVAIGQLTDNARRFAAEKNIRVMQGADLAELLRGMVHSHNRQRN